MAKATIVSTLPFGFISPTAGLFPPQFDIAPAPQGSISTTIIEDGFHFMFITGSDEKAPPMKITDPGEKIAEGIVSEFMQANYGTSGDVLPNGAVRMPGVFWLPEVVSVQEVKVKHPSKIEQALKNTRAWFETLVIIADDHWRKSNKQYRSITDYQRAAASFLGLQREWNFDVFQALANRCWACKKAVDPDAIICDCKAILNMKEYEKRKGEFVHG